MKKINKGRIGGVMSWGEHFVDWLIWCSIMLILQAVWVALFGQGFSEVTWIVSAIFFASGRILDGLENALSSQG